MFLLAGLQELRLKHRVTLKLMTSFYKKGNGYSLMNSNMLEIMEKLPLNAPSFHLMI